RRSHLREADVERARLNASTGSRKRSLGGLDTRAYPVDVAARDRIHREQAGGAAIIGMRQGQIAARARNRGSRFIQRSNERAWVDGEKELALVHHRAVLEVKADDRAGHARANLDALAGIEAARIIVPL